MQLERDWGDALAKRDLVTLDRILGDDHSVISKDGSVLTKAQELATHSESADELFDFEPMRVRVFDDRRSDRRPQREISIPRKGYERSLSMDGCFCEAQRALAGRGVRVDSRKEENP
jgi:hypothetical protein